LNLLNYIQQFAFRSAAIHAASRDLKRFHDSIA
jgi:hypothetical protein